MIHTQTHKHDYTCITLWRKWRIGNMKCYSCTLIIRVRFCVKKKTFKIVWFAWLLINKKWKSIVSFIENSIQFILNSLKRIWREKKRQISFLFSSQFELIISIIICEFIFGLFRLINELIIINKFYINMQYMCWICVYIDFDFL